MSNLGVRGWARELDLGGGDFYSLASRGLKFVLLLDIRELLFFR